VAIEQIRIGNDNFSYVIYCPIHKKAAIVDPSFDTTKSIQFITTNDLILEYIILTHYHSDHSAETKHLKKVIPSSRIVSSKEDGQKLPIKPDIFVYDKSQLKVGNILLSFLLTPGHTPGGICIIIDEKAILTGDTLFIGDCGRTDLPGGNLVQMYASLHEKIMKLPDELIIYPGHDYGEKPFDRLGNQKCVNKTLLAKNLMEFSIIR
jgi:glyoxylase-like metal-dependent hydrolase (beta-lactamase superfamily II)